MSCTFRIASIRLILLLSSLFAVSPALLATETDQFSTPGVPLYDIGPLVSRKIVDIIESDRTGDDPDRVLIRWVGHNVVSSRLVRWVKTLPVIENRIRFRPGPFHSIYSTTLSPLPASFWFDSPTVNLFGYYFGTDKLDHFFQQGHQYAELVMRNQALGTDANTAVALAVAHGVKQEHTYYGVLVSGVYSNGDLAANFAGMKFYLNLRNSVRIGERVLPPLFERSEKGWRLRRGTNPDRLLELFLSNHLDESLNPSRYRFSRNSIRSSIRNRCSAWAGFYADRVGLVAQSGQSFAATWFGEDYGHWLPPEDEISIATECPVAGPLDISIGGSM